MRYLRPQVVCSILVLLCISAFLSMPSADTDCTITLGTIPEPPECVENPGGVTTINWEIEYSTSADYVHYYMTDPGDNIVEEETYPGETGISIERNWTVPEGAAEGAYWVHVDFYSEEVGLEGAAEVVFLVCVGVPPTATESVTWGQIKEQF